MMAVVLRGNVVLREESGCSPARVPRDAVSHVTTRAVYGTAGPVARETNIGTLLGVGQATGARQLS